jgi:hypothetical protein
MMFCVLWISWIEGGTGRCLQEQEPAKTQKPETKNINASPVLY